MICCSLVFSTLFCCELVKHLVIKIFFNTNKCEISLGTKTDANSVSFLVTLFDVKKVILSTLQSYAPFLVAFQACLPYPSQFSLSSPTTVLHTHTVVLVDLIMPLEVVDWQPLPLWLKHFDMFCNRIDKQIIDFHLPLEWLPTDWLLTRGKSLLESGVPLFFPTDSHP